MHNDAPLIKGHRIYCVTREVLHFVHRLYSPWLEVFFHVLNIYERYDHNSLRITDLFSGHTICFCALPIYFPILFLLFSFTLSLHSIKSDLISFDCIASICWQSLWVRSAHINVHRFEKELSDSNESFWINIQNVAGKCNPNENRIEYCVWCKIDSKSTIMTMNCVS